MSGILPFLTLNDFVFFTLVLARMAGLFAAIPIFGGQRVPLTVKAAAILAIALVLFPIVRDKIPQMPAAILLGGEAGICCVGWIVAP